MPRIGLTFTLNAQQKDLWRYIESRYEPFFSSNYKPLKFVKVYTCTPVRFKGDYTFFARDSGLFSVGLNQIGIESRPIMPGPEASDDDPRLLRTDYSNLESSEWWRNLNIDGLILYSWASPKYNPVVKAVHEAGIPVMVFMDTSGIISNLSPSSEFWLEAHQRFLYENRSIGSMIKEAYRLLADLFFNRNAKLRLPHYDAATAVATVTPLGAMWIPGEASGLGRHDIANKFVYLPHPQLEIFRYDGREKENLVLTVARWEKDDWPQKNPTTLLNAYAEFLAACPDWKGLIVGRGATELLKNQRMKSDLFDNRLEFKEHITPDELPTLYSRAKIGFWSSRWEGQQGTGAQALCCGCSVVSHDSAHMSCFRHYVTRASGRLARHNNSSALARELILESDAWIQGHRDPKIISNTWCDEFHAQKVAHRAINFLDIKFNR